MLLRHHHGVQSKRNPAPSYLLDDRVGVSEDSMCWTQTGDRLRISIGAAGMGSNLVASNSRRETNVRMRTVSYQL